MLKRRVPPWHVSFSYARVLQNTVLKTWQGLPKNVDAAQKAFLIRAKANSIAQLGKAKKNEVTSSFFALSRI